MNRIESLIAELCPDGVVFKNLGDLITSNRGGGTPSRQNASFWDGDIKWASVGDITATSISIKETRQTISHYGLENSSSNLIPAGSVLIATKIAPGEMRVLESEIAINQDIRGVSLSEEINPYFLVYFSKTIRVSGSGTIVKGITKATLDKIRIPVPPLQVQEAIVEILDKFQALEAELEAELEARKKQYEYYRDQLLSFSENGEDVRWMTLSEVAEIGTGNHDTKDAEENGEFIFYARGRVPLRLSTFDFDETAIITAGDGVGVGKVFHFAQGKYALHQRAYRIVPSDIIEPRFLYHYLNMDFARYLERTSVHASVTSLRKPMFLKYKIPLPPLSEQQRIVDILDKFDALVSDLTAGLPAEIEARRKQYEYYRDQLLTFKELAS